MLLRVSFFLYVLKPLMRDVQILSEVLFKATFVFKTHTHAQKYLRTHTHALSYVINYCVISLIIGKQMCDNVVLDIQRCLYPSSEDLLLIINIQIMCKYEKYCFVIVYNYLAAILVHAQYMLYVKL